LLPHMLPRLRRKGSTRGRRHGADAFLWIRNSQFTIYTSEPFSIPRKTLKHSHSSSVLCLLIIQHESFPFGSFWDSLLQPSQLSYNFLPLLFLLLPLALTGNSYEVMSIRDLSKSKSRWDYFSQALVVFCVMIWLRREMRMRVREEVRTRTANWVCFCYYELSLWQQWLWLYRHDRTEESYELMMWLWFRDSAVLLVSSIPRLQ
jgi:hypothetical protein